MRVRDLRGWGGRLIELAWELNELGFDSVVRFPPDQQASMEIFLSPGQRRPTTEQRGRVSGCAWGRRHEQGTRTRARKVCERITRGTR
ncbi:hypothetical protein ACSDR0_36655 [Streptosporangium sp. G11]|uniref:hypothetical protein n=1 Tax=Streptosporangium sp. G11 TaxID=3436926 RepID=UPI003EBBCDB9